ncbi:MAG TPA: hypothetical protein VGL99_32630 [Chloroflexota bacterium]
MAHEATEPWLEFLAQAQDIVQQWEESGVGRLLTTAAAADLAERIARGLRRAYERGLAEAQRA